MLSPFNPLIKFTVVKAVVFLTFWQVGTLARLGPSFSWDFYVAVPGRGGVIALFCVEVVEPSLEG